jgi:hypothetical protein
MRGGINADGFIRWPGKDGCLFYRPGLWPGWAFVTPHPASPQNRPNDFRERSLQARDSFASAAFFAAGEKGRMRGGINADGFIRQRVRMDACFTGQVYGRAAYSGPLTRPLPKIIA